MVDTIDCRVCEDVTENNVTPVLHRMQCRPFNQTSPTSLGLGTETCWHGDNPVAKSPNRNYSAGCQPSTESSVADLSMSSSSADTRCRTASNRRIQNNTHSHRSAVRLHSLFADCSNKTVGDCLNSSGEPIYNAYRVDFRKVAKSAAINRRNSSDDVDPSVMLNLPSSPPRDLRVCIGSCAGDRTPVRHDRCVSSEIATKILGGNSVIAHPVTQSHTHRTESKVTGEPSVKGHGEQPCDGRLVMLTASSVSSGSALQLKRHFKHIVGGLTQVSSRNLFSPTKVELQRTDFNPEGSSQLDSSGDELGELTQCTESDSPSPSSAKQIFSIGNSMDKLRSNSLKVLLSDKRSKWQAIVQPYGAMDTCSPSATTSEIITNAAESNGIYHTMDTRRILKPRPTCLLDLTDEERLALQSVSLAKLNQLDLGCTVVLPKGLGASGTGSGEFKKKFDRFKKYVNTGSLLHGENSPYSAVDNKGLVFGIPLEKCLANEVEFSVGPSTKNNLKTSSSSDNLVDALPHISCTLSSTVDDNCKQQLLVPYVVRACCQHMHKYGRHVPGIFRVTGVKSRVTTLRHEFDSGRPVPLTQEHIVHDVASLLKEFFRDLPDPLLTRDLFTAFLATASIDDVNKRVAVLRLLVCLLPPANRDTLWALLNFLGATSSFSNDTVDENGQLQPGNKMDSLNLATVFGPNLLNKPKTGKVLVDGVEQMSFNAEIIAVTKDLIDFHAAIFRLTKELYDGVLDSRASNHYRQRMSSSHNNNGCIKICPPDNGEIITNLAQIKTSHDSILHNRISTGSRTLGQFISTNEAVTKGLDRLPASLNVRNGRLPNACRHSTISDWEKQRWRHWELLADQSNGQASEQQTLV